MSDYDKGFDAGGEYVLRYLADVFEGVEDTDVWAEFISDAEDEK